MTTPGYLRVQSDGVLLSLKVQPRASANQICQPLGAELKVKITAPPVDSAANDALVEFLAKTFDCPRSKVELVRGRTSPHKIVKLHGLSEAAALSKLPS